MNGLLESLEFVVSSPFGIFNLEFRNIYDSIYGICYKYIFKNIPHSHSLILNTAQYYIFFLALSIFINNFCTHETQNKPTIIISLYKLHLKCFLPSFPFRIQAHSRALCAVCKNASDGRFQLNSLYYLHSLL